MATTAIYCPNCGERAALLSLAEDTAALAEIMCAPCWGGAFRHGRLHIPEAYQDESGADLGDPETIPATDAQLRAHAATDSYRAWIRCDHCGEADRFNGAHGIGRCVALW